MIALSSKRLCDPHVLITLRHEVMPNANCRVHHSAFERGSPPDIQQELAFKGPGVPVYLAPWTACPPGGKSTAVGLPSGGQAVPGYLAPHPGYLHPRGASCPGRFILPPRPQQVKIYICYFVICLYQFHEFRSSISH